MRRGMNSVVYTVALSHPFVLALAAVDTHWRTDPSSEEVAINCQAAKEEVREPSSSELSGSQPKCPSTVEFGCNCRHVGRRFPGSLRLVPCECQVYISRMQLLASMVTEAANAKLCTTCLDACGACGKLSLKYQKREEMG